jgi:hypothetical protein
VTVDQRPSAERLEQFNRRVVRSEIADVGRIDLEKLCLIENSNLPNQKSEETDLIQMNSTLILNGFDASGQP